MSQSPQYSPNPSPAVGNSAVAESKDSFFGSLFDLTFTKFVTVGFVKVIYVLGIIGVVLTWLGAAFSTFGDSIGHGFGILLLGWIPALLAVLLMRLSVELTVAIVRTAQNTAALAQSAASMASSTGPAQR